MEWALKIFNKGIVAFLAGLGVLLSFPDAFADRFNTETSSSAEFLGMGNAAISSGRGPYAMFYNPANLSSKETKTVIQPINMQLDANPGLLGQGLSVGSFANLSSLYGSLKKTPDNYVSGRYSIYPNLTSRYFSFGLLYEKAQGAMVRSTDGALIVRARDRFAPSAATSLRLLSGILRFGLSLQLLTVGAADETYLVPVNTSSLSYGSAIKSGMGISKNVGVTVTLPIRYLPSFSLVGRDLASTTYSSRGLLSFGSAGKPTAQPMTFDLAISGTMYLTRRIELKGEFDYKDVTLALGGTVLQRGFMGADLVFFDLIHLRGGLAHGYFTGGLGFDTRKSSLDIATYADEFGSALRGSADRRYVFQYTWGFL